MNTSELLSGCGRTVVNIIKGKNIFCNKKDLCMRCEAKIEGALMVLDDEKEFLDNIIKLVNKKEVMMGSILYNMIIDRLKQISLAQEELRKVLE